MEINDMLAPPPVKLPEDPAQTQAKDYTPRELAAKYPASPYAWAVLAEEELEQALTPGSEPASFITAYAYARTGYHRGLDRLRLSGILRKLYGRWCKHVINFHAHQSTWEI